MDELTFVVSVSAAIYGTLEAFKKVKPQYSKSKWMEIWPLLIGGSYACAAGYFAYDMHPLQSLPFGLLAGTFSSTSYRVVKKFLRSTENGIEG